MSNLWATLSINKSSNKNYLDHIVVQWKQCNRYYNGLSIEGTGFRKSLIPSPSLVGHGFLGPGCLPQPPLTSLFYKEPAYLQAGPKSHRGL